MTRFVCLCLSLLLPLSLCACFAPAQTENEQPLILTSNFALYDFARTLISEAARCEMLLPAGVDVHSYEPTPQDIVALQNCDLFLYIGGEGEQHIRAILDSLPELESLALYDLAEATAASEHEHAEHEDEHSHEPDEHIWTSPKNALRMVDAIGEKLSELFPGEQEAIRTRLADYRTELSHLDADFAEKTKDLGLIVFGDRFPFVHLAEAYGLDTLSAIDGCGEDSEPSAARISRIIDTVKSQGVRTVYYTETSSGRIAESIASETGADTCRLHSCHNLSEAEREEDPTYLELMRENLEALTRA